MKHYINLKHSLLATVLIALLCGCSEDSPSADDVNAGGDDNNGVTNPDVNTAPVAVAGDDMLASKNFNIPLNASASSDADGDSLSYKWLQTAGPDVTQGAGYLSGETPQFQAPSEVSTVVFELVVNDGEADSNTDTLIVHILENANAAYFVDGDNGNDTDGNGSQALPFASIAKALCEVTPEQQDIYVMKREAVEINGIAVETAYDEIVDPCPGLPERSEDKILNIPTGTSLYSGYDQNWVRDPAVHQALVKTTHYGFIFKNVNTDSWFSGFKVITGSSPTPADSVTAVSAINGTAGMHITDNVITASDVILGNHNSPGSSYGVIVALLDNVVIERNSITSGKGGNAFDLNIGFVDTAADGAPGTGVNTAISYLGSAGGTGAGGNHGGSGGAGGTLIGSNGANGGRGLGDVSLRGLGGCGGGMNNGANGCVGEVENGDHGWSGSIGLNGANGDAGTAGTGSGSIIADIEEVRFSPDNGVDGSTGVHGGGGAGGGGGEATLTGANGGGGGGGGGGGTGGNGGYYGYGGGASIGLLVAAITQAPEIHFNTISSSTGGNGATGSLGQTGGTGGARGFGFKGNGANNINYGGHGAKGGTGGNGGRGGAGGGGPSYAIALNTTIEAAISNNTITSGDGGQGGDGGENGHSGDGGNSHAVYSQAGSIIPLLTNNSVSNGVAGDGGIFSGTVGSDGNPGNAAIISW
ncbi:MAG: PKD domain-containing protein [Gammaproteobacteria bacterium]|nr:PKD domain-containing protein [Gammaproteobacteria bacterium]